MPLGHSDWQTPMWKLHEIVKSVPLQISATQYPFWQANFGLSEQERCKAFCWLGKVWDLVGIAAPQSGEPEPHK